MWKSMTNRQRIYTVLGSLLTLNGLILLFHACINTNDVYQVLTGANLFVVGFPMILDQLLQSRKRTSDGEDAFDEDGEEGEERRERIYILPSQDEPAKTEQKKSRKKQPEEVEEKPVGGVIYEDTDPDEDDSTQDEIDTLRKEIKNLGGRIRRAIQKEEKVNTQLTEMRKEARTVGKKGTAEERNAINEKMSTIRNQLQDIRNEIKQMEKDRDAKKKRLEELTSESKA